MNEPQITLQLSVNEAQVVLSALAKLPFENVADLWFKVKTTAEQQVAAQQAIHEGAGAAATDVGSAA